MINTSTTVGISIGSMFGSWFMKKSRRVALI
jgi:hypothetical protein